MCQATCVGDDRACVTAGGLGQGLAQGAQLLQDSEAYVRQPAPAYNPGWARLAHAKPAVLQQHRYPPAESLCTAA